MKLSISSYILIALVPYLALLSTCGPEGGIKPTPLASPGSNVVVDPSPPEFEFSKAKGFVNDLAGVLSEKELIKLESTLAELQRRGKIDFAIVLVKTTNGKDIFDFSLALAKEWKVGSEKGGILVVVAIDDRKWRIQIDKKLENEFTDAEIRSIGDTMVSHFRDQKYYDGLTACVNKFIGDLALRFDFEPLTL